MRRSAVMTFKSTVLPVVAAVMMPVLVSLGCGPAVQPEQVEAALELDRPTRKSIQRGLRAEGFDPGAPDGLFGPRTRAAIRRWQESRGTSATGFLDGPEAEGLHASGAASRSASGGSTTPASLETQIRVEEPGAGRRGGIEEAASGGADAESEQSAGLMVWVRAVDASMAEAERAAAEAEASAAGAGGWFSRTSACLDAQGRMTSALDHVAGLTVGEDRPAAVAGGTGDEVYVELGARMEAVRERARAACASIERPR